ncbi:tubulin binding cofactor A [Massariosphaeria phaeospora]|uniref:Tubulin-specific chaperone A n=1 Tax=Massariosphaeria phaeospora TaxID=100035 RepID=A0A7C8IHX8_9PLEO|nr:tubulin binding cofactor A [Massariosphaeria phaeospora]
MAPSQVVIATKSVQRLVKEEASYHKELENQEGRIKKLLANFEGENAEFELRQERQALQETKNVLPTVREKIKAALQKLEDQLESSKEGDGEESTEEITKAKEAIADGKKALREIS